MSKKQKYPRYVHRNLQAGDVIAIRGYTRLWQVLMLEKGHKMNSTRTGLHAFGGCWYPGDVVTPEPYGKIKCLSLTPPADVVRVFAAGTPIAPRLRRQMLRL